MMMLFAFSGKFIILASLADMKREIDRTARKVARQIYDLYQMENTDPMYYLK